MCVAAGRRVQRGGVSVEGGETGRLVVNDLNLRGVALPVWGCGVRVCVCGGGGQEGVKKGV